MAKQPIAATPEAGSIENEIIYNKWVRIQGGDLTSDTQILARHLDKLTARLTTLEDAYGDACDDTCDECDLKMSDENGYSSEGEAAFYRGAGFTPPDTGRVETTKPF